ncbi:hypothetical protein [Micromonospora sp. NPDC047730]|uniref:hypothetical protein n=1 Tax=Micromonospora sp. NPDC047730 TaxID=3364253 RepID=UPI003724A392
MPAFLLRFNLNRSEVERIAVGSECRQMVRQHGEMAKAYAEGLASEIYSGADDDDGIHYRDSFELDVLTVHGITPEWPMSRAGSRLWNSAPHAGAIEFGYQGLFTRAEGQEVLGRTLDFLWSLDGRIDASEFDYDDGDEGSMSVHDWTDE